MDIIWKNRSRLGVVGARIRARITYFLIGLGICLDQPVPFGMGKMIDSTFDSSNRLAWILSQLWIAFWIFYRLSKRRFEESKVNPKCDLRNRKSKHKVNFENQNVETTGSKNRRFEQKTREIFRKS